MILVISMIFAAIFAYASLSSIVRKAKEDTQRVLDSFVIENAAEIYASIKNGNHDAIGREYSERFIDRLHTELGLSRQASVLYNRSMNHEVIFQFNDTLTGTVRNDVLELKTDFKIIVPVWFAGNKLFDLTIPLQVKSLYVLKY